MDDRENGADGPGDADADAMRNRYAAHRDGADGWFREFGGSYGNPHEDAVSHAVARLVASDRLLPGQRVLDLATGSGEVWRALRSHGFAPEHLVACDPYTATAFERRTGHRCRSDSFADIAGGSLADSVFDRVVCAYALHLCEPSRLPGVCLALAAVSPALVIITPHKQPTIAPAWGWRLSEEHHEPGFRVRTRIYLRTETWGAET